MSGGQIIRASGARGVAASGGVAIMGSGGADCGCCGDVSNCTRCSGGTPAAISVAFSGIVFRNLLCAACLPRDTFTWLRDPNSIYSLALAVDNELGCSFSVNLSGQRQRTFFIDGCTGTSTFVDFNLNVLVTLPRTGGATIQMVLDQGTIGIRTIFRHDSPSSVCIRDLGPLANQVPNGYSDACAMGGGGGIATISF